MSILIIGKENRDLGKNINIILIPVGVIPHAVRVVGKGGADMGHGNLVKIRRAFRFVLF